MLKKILTYVNEGAVYYGLEVSGHKGRTVFNLLEVQQKKQELFIGKQETFPGLEQIAELVKAHAPLFLVINTDKVLTKILDQGTNTEDEALVHKAFPNLDFNSFYYELIKAKNKVFISICRKEIVQGYLEQFKEHKLEVANVFLGVAAINSITDYLTTENVAISNARLQLHDGALEKVIPNTDSDLELPEHYDINGLTVKSPFVLGFSAVLGHLLGVENRYGSLTDTNTVLKTEFTNKRHFKLLLQGALITVLSLLFINFLLFNHYYQKVNGLQETLALNDSNKEQLLKLKVVIQKKEERVNAVLSAANSKTSFYMDRITKNMPASLLLNEMVYQPLVKPLRDAKPIELTEKNIIVSGQVTNSQEFYEWVAALENVAWIKNVETTDYDYGSKTTSNFSVKILLNE